MDDKVKNIIMRKLKDWEGQSMTSTRLAELKEIIVKKTGQHKYLPFVTLKKWIKEVRKELRAKEREKARKSKEEKKEERAPEKKDKPMPTPTQPEQRPLSPFAERVYFQNISYEISSMRRALERISRQLDDLEGKIAELKGEIEEEA